MKLDTIVWRDVERAPQDSGIYTLVQKNIDGTYGLKNSYNDLISALPEEVTELKRFHPPFGYKGGKRKCAPEIVEFLISKGVDHYLDVGCGSGAITLELLRKGIPPTHITMIDSGPWGRFWKEVGEGTFPLEEALALFREADSMPPKEVKEWLETDVALRPFSTPHFLILQAGSYGSTPIWRDSEGWRRGDHRTLRRYAARTYWEPTEASKETKPRATIYTIPKIMQSLKRIAIAGKGLQAFCGKAEDWEPSFFSGITYIDPPYEGTSGYGEDMDVDFLLSKFKALGPVYVSEGKPLEGGIVYPLGNRKKASLSGESGKQFKEYLTEFIP